MFYYDPLDHKTLIHLNKDVEMYHLIENDGELLDVEITIENNANQELPTDMVCHSNNPREMGNT